MLIAFQRTNSGQLDQGHSNTVFTGVIACLSKMAKTEIFYHALINSRNKPYNRDATHLEIILVILGVNMGDNMIGQK